MDPYVDQLRRMFLTHPAWIKAGKYISDSSASRVVFTHLPGDYQLERKGGQAFVVEGVADDPDFAFRFTPKSIEKLAAVPGDDIGDFAVALFECVLSEDPEMQVGLRVLGGYTRLLFRGYVTLFFKGGPKLLAFAGSRGIHNVNDLRKLIKQASGDDPRWNDLSKP